MTYKLAHWELGYMDGIKGLGLALDTLEYKAGHAAGNAQRIKEGK